jgi:hypothetical protein
LNTTRLDRYARARHLPAQSPDDRLVAGGLHRVVVDAVIARRLQPGVARCIRVVVGGVEEEEFQLAGRLAGQAERGQAVHLLAEHGARRLDDGLAVLVVQVADDHRGGGLPGEQAHGGKVGLHAEVAEPGLPVGQREAVERVHLDVEGEEVIAAVRAAVGDVVEEVVGGEPLADEAAENVGEDDDNGVDVPGLDLRRQCFEVHAYSRLLKPNSPRRHGDTEARPTCHAARQGCI